MRRNVVEKRVNAPLLEWSDQLALGESTMDDTHREFVVMLNAVGAAPEGERVNRLDAFIKHTEAHFGQEERWMQEFAFPPLHCHQGEHANVLEIMREVRKRVAGGETHLGRTLAEAIAEWFPQHAGSMDAVLSLYMKQIGYRPGGDNAAVLANLAPSAASACAPGADACGHAAPIDKS